MKVTFSVVLYNSNYEDIKTLISNLLDCFESEVILYLVDNSPNNNLKNLSQLDTKRIVYLFNPSNPGFGAAHNLAIEKAIAQNSKYHFVINPDITIIEDVINIMVQYMENNSEVGMMMPKILNKDRSTQFLPKLLPSPQDILLRKLHRPRALYNKFINQYELRQVDDTIIYQAPVLSGCFTLFRIDALEKIGLYDDRFFMYFEDWDISRRMHKQYKTIVFQKAAVIHEYESGANKNKKLFKIFIQSAIRYFNKWGWFFDSERKKINKKTLQQF